MNISLGKAGRKRWMGRKPHNRGTSMNPVSHPMGGGEGRTAGGRHPCSPTGVLAKGGKTRKKRKPSNAAIVRRRRPGPHYADEIIACGHWTAAASVPTIDCFPAGVDCDESVAEKRARTSTSGCWPRSSSNQRTRQPRADQDLVARLHDRAGVRRRRRSWSTTAGSS